VIWFWMSCGVRSVKIVSQTRPAAVGVEIERQVLDLLVQVQVRAEAPGGAEHILVLV